MRAVNFRDGVLYRICHEIGIDPDQDLNKDHGAALVSYINNWVKDGWEAWPWPDLNLTEERAFRPNWYNDTAYIRSGQFNRPSEIYYLVNQTYYRVKADAAGDPPVGTLPTDTNYFLPITDALDLYVDYDQPGKQSIGMVRGISSVDPSISTGRSVGYEPGDNGLAIFGSGGPTVWIRFQLRPSEFSAEAHSLTKAYTRGALVYDRVTGECYRALLPNTGVAVTTLSTWLLQPMPEVIAAYVLYNAAADAADDVTRESSLRGKAQRAFQRETDKLLEQGAKLPRYGTGRGMRHSRRGLLYAQ